MQLLDISLGIGPDLMTWPGDPAVAVEPSARLSRGDPANVSELRLGSHTGTHVDPPHHFIDGEVTVDLLPLDLFHGEAVVADLTGVEGKIGPWSWRHSRLPMG
jgi:arylformamidase